MMRLMNLLALIVAAATGVLLLSRTQSDASAQEDKKPAQKAGLEGTWEQTDGEANQRVLLVITKTHFAWFICDKEKKTILKSAGGRWTLKDGVFTEKFEFVSGGDLEKRLGKEDTFKVKVEDEKLTTNGITPNKSKQEWKRLK